MGEALAKARNLAQRVIDSARRGELLQSIPRWLGRLGGKRPFSQEGVNLTYLDTEYGLDTGGAVNLAALTADGLPYYGIAPSMFRAIMKHVTLDRIGATFIDFGSGKGRAIFLAAEYGFRRITGVEILETLHAVAVRNTEIYRAATGAVVAIEPVLCDVASFAIPPGPVLAYLYNPFGEKTMKQVLRNLEAAHERTGQRIDIAYGHPSYEKLLDTQAWLRKTGVLDVDLTAEELERCVMGLKSLRIACYSTSPT
jgi:predicted RNA methylase